MSKRCTEEINPNVEVFCTLDPDEEKEAFCEIMVWCEVDGVQRGSWGFMNKAEARKLAEHILECLEVSA